MKKRRLLIVLLIIVIGCLGIVAFFYGATAMKKPKTVQVEAPVSALTSRP